MDDVLAIIKREEVGTILEKLNRAHKNIEFIMDIEKQGEIPLLDLQIIRGEGGFEVRHFQETDPNTTNHHIYLKPRCIIHRMVTTPLIVERRNELHPGNSQEKRIQEEPHRKPN